MSNYKKTLNKRKSIKYCEWGGSCISNLWTLTRWKLAVLDWWFFFYAIITIVQKELDKLTGRKMPKLTLDKLESFGDVIY